MTRKWVNQTADDVMTISGTILNYDTRVVANNHRSRYRK